jgi:hypothetical protein
MQVNHAVAKATFILERQLKADAAREGTITIPPMIGASSLERMGGEGIPADGEATEPRDLALGAIYLYVSGSP